MTLTIAGQTRELPPEVEAAIMEKARRRGQSAADYLVELAMRDESQTPAPMVFSTDREQRNAQIRALLHAPREVVAATLQNGAAVMAPHYERSLAENGELTDMTAALQGEPFDNGE